MLRTDRIGSYVVLVFFKVYLRILVGLLLRRLAGDLRIGDLVGDEGSRIIFWGEMSSKEKMSLIWGKFILFLSVLSFLYY